MDNTPHFDAARRSFLARSLDAADVDAAGTQDEESAARTREFLRGQRHVSQSQLFGDVDDADHHDGPLRPPAGDDDDDDDDDGGYAAAAAAAAAAVLDRLVAHCALLGCVCAAAARTAAPFHLSHRPHRSGTTPSRPATPSTTGCGPRPRAAAAPTATTTTMPRTPSCRT